MRIACLICCFLFPFLLKADAGDVLNLPKDSVKTDTVRQKLHSPKRAAIYSAVLPGLGQIYNRKYWKAPIVYAGFGGLGFGFGFNQKYYKIYRDALRLRYDDDPNTIDQFTQYSDDDLVTLKNYYQRYRDLCVIGAAALYTLQIIDAAVDAHLFYFDVSDNLSMQFQPGIFPSNKGMNCSIGIRLGFH